MIAFFKLIRYPNLLIIAFSQLLLFYTLPTATIFRPGGVDASLWSLILVMMATVFSAAAGYVINDYYDIEIDKINKKRKVIIGKSIPKKTALKLYAFLNILALISSISFSFKFAILVAFVIILLFLYASQLKRIAVVGNVLVALLSAFSILIMVYYKNSNMVISLSILAFILSWVREIIKDLQDIKGDKMYGHKNMVVLFGETTSLWVARILLLLLAYFLLSFFSLFSKNILFIAQLYFGFLFIQIAFNIYLTFMKQYARQSVFLKILMLSGICLALLI